MTDPDDQLSRVLRTHAEAADVPPGLAATARRRSVRRRGAVAGAAAVVLLAGVAVTSVVVGGTHDRADSPGPATPSVSAVDVCAGNPTGPSPTRAQLRGLDHVPVVVCRSWSVISIPGVPPTAPPTAALLSDADADQLREALAAGPPAGDPCVGTGPISRPTDQVVLDPGPEQRVVEVPGLSCLGYDLGGQAVGQQAALTDLLARLAKNGTTMRQSSDSGRDPVLVAGAAASSCRSRKPGASPERDELFAPTAPVVLCHYVRPRTDRDDPPDPLVGAVTVSGSSAARIIDLLRAGTRARGECYILSSYYFEIVLDDGRAITVPDGPNCLPVQLGADLYYPPAGLVPLLNRSLVGGASQPSTG